MKKDGRFQVQPSRWDVQQAERRQATADRARVQQWGSQWRERLLALEALHEGPLEGKVYAAEAARFVGEQKEVRV